MPLLVEARPDICEAIMSDLLMVAPY